MQKKVPRVRIASRNSLAGQPGDFNLKDEGDAVGLADYLTSAAAKAEASEAEADGNSSVQKPSASSFSISIYIRPQKERIMYRGESPWPGHTKKEKEEEFSY